MHWMAAPLSRALLIVLLAAGCSNLAVAPTPVLTSTPIATPTSAPAPTATHTPGPAAQLVPRILSVRPHDTSSYTEGLVWTDGLLYESSGLYGVSSVRKVDPQTGRVLSLTKDPPQVFGEGLALDGKRLYQLTWKEQIGFIYDLDTLSQTGSFSYKGEGWGLCFDGHHFIMSNGSAFLSIRDAKTFAVLNSVHVMLNGAPVNMLNELECVGGSVYANVWLTDHIVRIDAASGRVTAVIDASGLLTQAERAAAGSDGVLNGIAYDPATDTFFITGKRWPKLFEVTFVPRGSD